jgi:hypothetical protein
MPHGNPCSIGEDDSSRDTRTRGPGAKRGRCTWDGGYPKNVCIVGRSVLEPVLFKNFAVP